MPRFRQEALTIFTELGAPEAEDVCASLEQPTAGDPAQ